MGTVGFPVPPHCPTPVLTRYTFPHPSPTNKALCTQQSVLAAWKYLYQKFLSQGLVLSTLKPTAWFWYTFSYLCTATSLALYCFHFLHLPVRPSSSKPESSIWLRNYCILQKEFQPWDLFFHMATHLRFAVAQSKGKIGDHDTCSWSHTIHHWRPGADHNQVLVTLWVTFSTCQNGCGRVQRYRSKGAYSCKLKIIELGRSSESFPERVISLKEGKQ